MFICTANTMHNIPGPLQDRMEVIRIAGYTELEKLNIARRYLIPKEQEANGLTDVKIEITDDGAAHASSTATRASPACARWSARSAACSARSPATCSRTASATSWSTASRR